VVNCTGTRGAFFENRRDNMSLSSHLTELQKKHDNLSRQVESEQRSPGSSDLDIGKLKKQKLRLKEEIAKHGSN